MSKYFVIFLLFSSTYLNNYCADNTVSRLQLHTAIEANENIETISMLLKPENINELNQFEQTPLHAATLLLKKDVALLLITNGAKVDAFDKEGKDPLFYAQCCNLTEVVAALLDHGADSKGLVDANNAIKIAQTKKESTSCCIVS